MMATALIPDLSAGTVHMAVDMQRVFADETEWRMQNFYAIVPNVLAIAAALPDRTLFTRFVTPHSIEDAPGHWQNYYRRWREFTAAELSPELIEIVDALLPHVASENVIDKPTYSVFEVPRCSERLSELRADTIIFTGVETDVCVLASLMAAVDRGYRVIAVSDALGSSSEEGHDAALSKIFTRMPDQIEIVPTEVILAALARRASSGA